MLVKSQVLCQLSYGRREASGRDRTCILLRVGLVWEGAKKLSARPSVEATRSDFLRRETAIHGIAPIGGATWSRTKCFACRASTAGRADERKEQELNPSAFALPGFRDRCLHHADLAFQKSSAFE